LDHDIHDGGKDGVQGVAMIARLVVDFEHGDLLRAWVGSEYIDGIARTVNVHDCWHNVNDRD
jgi:hypothetical protein